MIHQEEIYAKQLYRELKSEFRDKRNSLWRFFGLNARLTKSDIGIVLTAAGTQSNCYVAKEDRQCTVHCFDVSLLTLGYKGPEFYISFKEHDEIFASGRTFDKRVAIESIKNWIGNETLEELYGKYHFINEEKRRLEKLRSDINASNAELLKISQNEVMGEPHWSYKLWFKHENRSCCVDYYGYDANPRYVFHWHDAIIFKASGSNLERLDSLIKRWVCDKAMPSVLQMEFPTIDFGKLSAYYESGIGVEGEFVLSWDSIEDFYKELQLDNKTEILRLIRRMREKGFDRTLRAGQSLYTLVLSRSRRHGLRENQNSVSFSFCYIKSVMEIRTQKGEIFEFDKVEYNDSVETILKGIELETIN
ncbi:hypothetical protein [Paraflavitalea pollutisoli]|uniref:hypothetical protein n=1 Tax=Paraflavitalea pollutisoli TaxID=3034143 RepID=UPI0023ED13D7|nr:hypothetical protein [Paraflavitalea sp. H1-2-19X]